MTWEKPDDLGWWWNGWYRDHYTNLAGVAADPYLRAMAIRKLSVTDIISYIDLFLAHEPVRQLAAAFLDRVYENRQVYLFSYIGSFGSRIIDLAHPELWLINVQAMNRIFAFDPVIELAAYIKVSKRKAARLLEDADYANSCGPNILALISDASHNLSDVATLIISLLGMKLAQKGATALYTYGYKKASILASFVNAVTAKIGRASCRERV